jgi:hypothetical protein
VRADPNQSLQPTAARITAFRECPLRQRAAAAELFRSAERTRQNMTSQERQRKRLVAASWGLALGCGGGVLLSAYYLQLFAFVLGYMVVLGEVVPIYFNGVVSGGLVGVVAGLAVGAAEPKASQSTLRLALTRGLIGLIASGPCVITLAVVWVIWLGLFHQGGNEYFPPGWGTALGMAVGWVIVVGPVLAVLGYVVGVAVALLIRDSY